MNKNIKHLISRGIVKFKRKWECNPEYLFLENDQLADLTNTDSGYADGGIESLEEGVLSKRALMWQMAVNSKDSFEEFSDSVYGKHNSLKTNVYCEDGLELLFVSVVEPGSLLSKPIMDEERLNWPYMLRDDFAVESSTAKELISQLKGFKHPLVQISARFVGSGLCMRFTGKYKHKEHVENYKKVVMDFCKEFKAENKCMSSSGQGLSL